MQMQGGRGAAEQYFMGLVFSAPHNDVFMVSALKTLPLDDVVVCYDYDARQSTSADRVTCSSSRG
jgi:hypothetical protein